jgi:hypothetical protein
MLMVAITAKSRAFEINEEALKFGHHVPAPFPLLNAFWAFREDRAPNFKTRGFKKEPCGF